jgi:hypothetical protein
MMRWSKIRSAAQAAEAGALHCCTGKVSDMNQAAVFAGEEFVGMDKHNYWVLVNERIAEAGMVPCRKDSVRCLEACFIAPPALFSRDLDGRTAECAQRDWVKAIRTFLVEQFGEQNLIDFRIHAVGEAAHLHAIIVPITKDGQLSARKMFSPSAMRGYHNEYAEVVKRGGLQ